VTNLGLLKFDGLSMLMVISSTLICNLQTLVYTNIKMAADV